MKSVWKAGLDAEKSRIVAQEFKASVAMRDKLAQIIESKINSGFVGARDPDGYDSPSWAYKQADFLGYMRAMKEILTLIENN